MYKNVPIPPQPTPKSTIGGEPHDGESRDNTDVRISIHL